MGQVLVPSSVALDVLGVHDLQGLLGLLVILAAASAFLSVGRQGARIKQLREDRDDRDKRITFLESENGRHEQVELQQERRIEGLQAEVHLLRDVVTGASGPHQELLRLVDVQADLIRSHNDAAMAGLSDLRHGQTDILRLLGSQRADRGEGDT